MSWYDDKVKNGTAQLLMAGAGGGAKALGALAKIPLAKDSREARDRKLQIEEDDARNRLIAAQVKAGASIEVATTKANAVITKAKIGRDGTHETNVTKKTVANTNAGAKVYVADSNKARGKYRSDTDALIEAGRIAASESTNATKTVNQVANNDTKTKIAKLKLKGQGVKPKVTIKYDADGKRIERTVVKPFKKEKSGANFVIDMESKAKKYKGRK